MDVSDGSSGRPPGVARDGASGWLGPIGLVRDEKHAGGRRLAIDQSEPGERRAVAEEALALAEHERMDHEPVGVDEVVLDQRLDQLTAADDLDLLA